MPEQTILPEPPQAHMAPEQALPGQAEIEAGLKQADKFLRDVAPHVGRLFGMDLRIQVGNGWATNMETGEVTADPRFFIEKGYTPDMAAYAVLHETAAHLREVVTDPQLTNRVKAFAMQGKAQAIFQNILADVAGNNLIHAVLPRMRRTAKELYSQKLFPDIVKDEQSGEEQPYSTLPRHLQFLYKIIRQEMIPGSHTAVLPEVELAINDLRDYQSRGDLIKYSTAVAKSSKEPMPGDERFTIWTEIIYPVYQELLEQDRQDERFGEGGEQQPGDQQQQSESGESGQDGQGQPDDSQNQESKTGEQKPGQPGESGGEKQDGQFGAYYQDYDENRHPEPMTEEEQDKLKEHAEQQQSSKWFSPNSPEAMRDKQLREETGHTLAEQRQYDAEILKWRSSIEDMREIFQRVINERVSQKRGLSRRTFQEGAILDPNRLPQTIIDIKSGSQQPEAFQDYQNKKGQTEAVGKTDYVFVLDISGSMQGEKAQSAAASAVIALEGLAALQRDIEQAEATNKLDLELDIRTAIYVFGSDSTCLKPLSTSLNTKQRLDTYSALQYPSGGSTNDFLSLEEVQQLPLDKERHQILIAVSDGESDNPSRARRAIDNLRGAGWFVYGISIGSEAAANLYKPTSRRVDDPAELPATLHKFIEATIT